MTDRSKTSDLEARLARVEAQLDAEPSEASARGGSGMETAVWSLMRTLLPDETRRHMRAATREQLLAARSYIDHWLARMDRKPGEPTEPEREHITLE
ncbi:MAG: hypothetical protein ABI534_03555 [Chloroflexota bacterium]